MAGALALVAVLAIGGLAARNAQLEQQRDAQIAQAQSLENLLDQFDRPGVQHALLAREDGSTIAAVVVENGRQKVFPIGIRPTRSTGTPMCCGGSPKGSSTPEPLGTFDVTGDDQGRLTVGSAARRLRRLRDLARAGPHRTGRADGSGGEGASAPEPVPGGAPESGSERRVVGSCRCGRLAQGESASFTPKRSLVRSQYRPPRRDAPDLQSQGHLALVGAIACPLWPTALNSSRPPRPRSASRCAA